jgi:hypothetical protein
VPAFGAVTGAGAVAGPGAGAAAGATVVTGQFTIISVVVRGKPDAITALAERSEFGV